MISEQSKSSISAALHRAAKTTLVRADTDVFEINSVSDRDEAIKGSSLLLITISSFVFRLLTIFEVSSAPSTQAYYAGTAAQPDISEQFAEFANMFCGALNRELSVHFPHMAMSIPYKLNGRCKTYLDGLRPQFRSTNDIIINDSVQVRVTLCMRCMSPVDIPASMTEVDHSGGELELF